MSGLSERRLWRIADCLEEETFEDRQRIIKQGTKGDAFYVIRKGTVKVFLSLSLKEFIKHIEIQYYLYSILYRVSASDGENDFLKI